MKYLFNVWIVMLTDYNYEKLIMELLNRQFAVEALVPESGLLQKDDDHIGVILSLAISTGKNKGPEPGKLRDEIRGLVDLLDMKVFSVIVTPNTGAAWSCSNVKQSLLKEKETGSPYRDNGGTNVNGEGVYL